MKRNFSVILFLFLLASGCAPVAKLLNYTPSAHLKNISFQEEPANPKYKFWYSDTLNNIYMRTLRQQYGIDQLAAQQSDEFGAIKAVLNWSSSQWKHNGSNTPSKSDALTILEEAKKGAQFRCVEYGILASACMNSVAIPARVLGLKTRDVEKVKFGAGHVVAEVYSKQYNKWIFMDPQFNVIPTLRGIPLNAVEFQKAIFTERNAIEMINIEGKVPQEKSEQYIQWVAKYLFYFDALFDQRIGDNIELQKIDGKTKLMLIPVGRKQPTIFQRKYPLDYCLYTNSINDFYSVPEN